MRNKRIIFGLVISLFVITGFCNIPNISAAETIEIPPLSYVYYYMGYLENKDEILINEIEVLDGALDIINVYIMNEIQFEILQDSGGITWTYLKRWQDIQWMYGWSIDITEDGVYYVVLYNKDVLFGRTVYVDIGVRHYSPPVKSDNFFLGWLLFIILPAIAGVVITIVLVRRRKRKIPKEDIKAEKTSEVQEKQIPKVTYCPECGTEILDKSRKFCSVCGTKIIK